jgi:hypothetical protein
MSEGSRKATEAKKSGRKREDQESECRIFHGGIALPLGSLAVCQLEIHILNQLLSSDLHFPPNFLPSNKPGQNAHFGKQTAAKCPRITSNRDWSRLKLRGS